MKVVLMEFANGGDVEAEVFENTNAMKQWFKNEYLPEKEDRENLSTILTQIDLGWHELNVGEFKAVVYYRYPIHMESRDD